MALVVELLIRAAANLGRCIGAVKLLLDRRDNDDNTLLMTAADTGRTRRLRFLVSAGADVNSQNIYGSSALGFASEKGYIGIVNILLDNGAQIETRDNFGRTPLWFAAANGQTDVVRALPPPHTHRKLYRKKSLNYTVSY